MEAFETEHQKQMHRQAIRSLAFGIVSLAFAHAVGIVFGILAIVQGNGSLRLAATESLIPDGRARVGRIFGIIGIVLGALSMIWSAIRLTGIIAVLVGSIESGSLGVIGDYFRELGESFRGLH